jgi:hypothetical protein
MHRKIALMAFSLLPAMLLFFSAMAPGAAAAPAAVASPSPRPSLTPPPEAGPCGTRVFDNLAQLVIFRCPDGALAFYRIKDGTGDFHSWLVYDGWASALPGKVAHDVKDAAGYRILFGRASQDDVNALKLAARTPAGKSGAWYHVILRTPGGTALTDDYFFMTF